MRNEKYLVEPVSDVHTHTREARRRTNGTGKLHGITHVPEAAYPESFLDQLKALFSPEVLDVAGRAVKGFVVPHWAAGVLLASILATGGFMYRSMSGQIADQGKVIDKQNELLIRLDQRLLDKGSHDSDRFEKLERKFESVEAWQGVTNKEIVRLQSKR